MANRSLNIRLTADTSSYRKGMQDAANVGSQSFKKNQRAFAGLDKNIISATSSLNKFTATGVSGASSIAGLYAGSYTSAIFTAVAAKKQLLSSYFTEVSAARSSAKAQIDAANADLKRLETEGKRLVAAREYFVVTNRTNDFRKELAKNTAKEIAAQERLVAGQKQLNSLRFAGGKALLGIMGGPIGVAATAVFLSVAAIGSYINKINEAIEASQRLASESRSLAGSFKGLSNIELTIKEGEMNEKIEKAKKGLDELRKRQILVKTFNPDNKEEIKQLSEQITLGELGLELIKRTIKEIKSEYNGQGIVQRELDRLKQIENAHIDTTEALKLKRRLSEQNLSVLNDEQKAELINAAKSVDAFNEKIKKQKEFNELVLTLRTTEEKQLDDLVKRLDLINQIEKSEERRNELISKAIQKREKPPSYNYSDEYSGIGSDLINASKAQEKLQTWYDTQQKMLEAALEKKKITQEIYNQEVLVLENAFNKEREKLDQASVLSSLGMFSTLTGQISDLFKQTAGEASAAYKIMFAVSKAAAIAQSIMSTEVAASKALELGPIAGIPAASLVRGLGYASVGVIAATSLAGMAHDGIDKIPKEGTWLLNKGERVLSPSQNKDFTEFMKKGNSSASINVNVPVTIDGGNTDENDARRLGDMIRQATIGVINEQMRPGGILNGR